MARIIVTPAEEDEVIFAGRQEPSKEEGSVARREPSNSENPAGHEGLADSKSASAAKPSRTREGAYRETSLEDLEPTKMPLAQRIVIVAAIVCIIGALVYYFVAMR